MCPMRVKSQRCFSTQTILSSSNLRFTLLLEKKEQILIAIFILTPLVEEQVEEVLSKELQGSQEEVTIC